MTFESHDEVFDIWMLLRRCSNAIVRSREKELKKYGASPVQAAALRAIKNKHEPTSAGEIAQYLHRESQSVSGLLNRMEDRNLIQRVKDNSDSRITRVVMTQKGEALHQKTKDSQVVDRIMSSLSTDELGQFAEYLERLMSKALENLKNS